MSTGKKRPVSVDDLLRLKRTERPAPGFWAEFDRQLRAKQLAALVEKRAWWRTAPAFGAWWPRVRVPLGVATVVGIGLLSVRSYRAPVVPLTAPEVALVPLEATPTPTATAVAAMAVEPAVVVSPAPEHPALSAADITLPAIAPVAAATVVEIAPPSQPALDRALVVPVLAVNPVADARGAAPAPRLRIDPLQQMTPPGESRRIRFLTAMVSTASADTSARISERAASRFAEDRLQDQAGRFGARGDRVQLKF